MRRLFFVLVSAVFVLSCAKTQRNYIDNMNDASVFVPANGSDSAISLSAAPGKVENCVLINYTLGNQDPWVILRKDLQSGLPANAAGIKFLYKGSGAVNSLELKISDKDGSVFGAVIGKATGAAEWTESVLPISGFTYWWGGTDQLLDRNNIANIEFAVSKKEGDAGGSGQISIDELEITLQ